MERVAIEQPSAPEQGPIARRAGLEPVFVPVDGSGLVVEALEGTGAGAVVLTPAHQHPTGVVLTPERRGALVDWLRAHDAVAIEDDYDAEYRYDRAAVGALQGLDPDRVVYAGSASKTLAPALRLGWMAVPAALLDAVRYEKSIADQTTARIEQHAMASFIGRGELDRHLRRMRLSYRARRDATIAAVGRELPDARIRGIAAGLHVTVTLAATGRGGGAAGGVRPPARGDLHDQRLRRGRVRRRPDAAARLRAAARGRDPGRRGRAGRRRARRGLEVELVGRVLAPGGARAVVEAGGVAGGVARGVLDGDQRHAAVEQHRHEGVAQLVRAEALDLAVLVADEPGLAGELGEQPVDRLAVVGDPRRGRARAQPAAVLAAEDRALGARADGLQDRAAPCAR